MADQKRLIGAKVSRKKKNIKKAQKYNITNKNKMRDKLMSPRSKMTHTGMDMD